MARPPTPPAADLDALAREALARCDALAAESEAPGALTRTFLSPPMRQVHRHVSGWMRDAGMTVRLDPAANLIGRHETAVGGAPALLIGSHLDTVPDAGKYDGVLGVVLGVAAVQALRGRGLPFAVEVVGFSEEEGVRYRTPYLGSLALSGRFDPPLLDRRDADGVTMADAFRAFGLDPARVAEAAYPPGSILAYVEAHIEQGPLLEAWGTPVGVVEAIAGQSRLRVAFEGRAGHAGTSPMELRRDALPAAAELVLEVERLARAVDGLRGTVGTIEARPGASNVVPGAASLSLDARHADDAVRDRAVIELLRRASSIAARRGLNFRVVEAEHHRAVPADPRLTALLDAAVSGAGVEPRRLVSGAGHDAAVMASVAPMAMLFLRSPGGISHHPDEGVLAGDVRTALDVLVRWVDALADRGGP
jgi:allantoate deiminase